MMETDKIYCLDCLEGLKQLPDKSIDLIMTDPPYLIKSTRAGGHNRLARTIQPVNNLLEENGLVSGMNPAILPELIRVMKKINCYVWCNKAQIPDYLDFFVGGLGCSFDILIWWKTNPPPTCNNKYLSDKEYCLYFRKGAIASLHHTGQQKQYFISQSMLRIKRNIHIPRLNHLMSLKHL